MKAKVMIFWYMQALMGNQHSVLNFTYLQQIQAIYHCGRLVPSRSTVLIEEFTNIKCGKQ